MRRQRPLHHLVVSHQPLIPATTLCPLSWQDGVKNAFGTAGGEKPLVAADRVTPFDRWLGLDKALIEQEEPDQSAAYIDPNDATNYFSVELSKPMGIAFVENDGECGGVYIDEVLSEGSAASATAPLQRGDQLVGVDATPVIGNDFDTALDVIKGTSGDTTKLTFFRGPTAFLYGPSARQRAPRATARHAPHEASAPHKMLRTIRSQFGPAFVAAGCVHVDQYQCSRTIVPRAWPARARLVIADH